MKGCRGFFLEAVYKRRERKRVLKREGGGLALCSSQVGEARAKGVLGMDGDAGEMLEGLEIREMLTFSFSTSTAEQTSCLPN